MFEFLCLSSAEKKYGDVCAILHVMDRKALIWSLSKGLKVSLVLLRVFGRNSLPDQNPSGSLALSICACHGQPIVATVSKHDVCPASAGRSETRSPSGSAPVCVAVPRTCGRSCGCLCLVVATHKLAGGPEKLTS